MPEHRLTVFGIRHHGPGSARSLLTALERLAPDILLVEGPSDAQTAIPLIAHPAMQPPVALLVYPSDHPAQAVYYPFTIFSPEWQALCYAARHDIPARFMDLPQAIWLASSSDKDAEAPTRSELTPDEEDLHEDPLGMLSRLAGYEDRELWWEQQVEQRRDATGLFEAILEMMGALREHAGPPGVREAQREAYMRQMIRAARKDGFRSIAVVCGAWHAPVLADPGPATADTATLARLPRVPTMATWIPWTNSRLSSRSGYGAGIDSPGWYEHLWQARDHHASRWVTHAARLLREQDLEASSASAIETLRLAEALAALRDLPMPGIAELNEAILTVLCHGQPAPLRLIRDRLEIGERLGAVPDETPAVPLQRDLLAWQRRLRLPLSAEIKPLDLDLRTENGLARSQLLHRLLLLHIPWGTPHPSSQRISTFHELWQVQWRPELTVRVIEANIWGDTVEAAATAAVRHGADDTGELPALTALLDGAILAVLPRAIDHLLQRVADQAAVTADLRHLMDALPPLAHVARYGDVRGTPAKQVAAVLDGLFERIITGLTSACASLDDDAAAAMVTSIGHVQESIALLDRAEQRAEWHAALRDLLPRDQIHGMVRGHACRLLLEAQVLDSTDLQRLAGQSLSPIVPASQAGSWAEGVLHGSALVLLHQDGLWQALDRWLRDLDPDSFTQVLPLLRRAFAGFQPPERRMMGEKVKQLSATGEDSRRSATTPLDLDAERAAAVLPVLARILGVAAGD